MSSALQPPRPTKLVVSPPMTERPADAKRYRRVDGIGQYEWIKACGQNDTNRDR